VVLFFGGIFGLSLVNSIFVDTMISDNNVPLEEKIEELEKKIDRLLEQRKD
jgi:voltage-gated sodium channel